MKLFLIRKYALMSFKTQLAIILSIFICTNALGQIGAEYPKLYPYQLGGKGNIDLPEEMHENLYQTSSDTAELRDFPNNHPYYTIAYFDTGKLISLHVVVGDTGQGLSYAAFDSIKKQLLKLWPDYPNRLVKNRGGMGNIAHIWETKDFRIEWTFKKQPDSDTKKIGHLFMYTRSSYVELDLTERRKP